MTQHALFEAPEISPYDLVVESNHRIANHLASLAAILRRQMSSVGDGPDLISRNEVVSVIQEAAGKIMAVSRLHQLFTLHPSDAVLDLGEVLRDMLQAFEDSGIFDGRLHAHATFDGRCQIRSAHASAIALASAEAITNAVKYAHPSGLPVELSIVATAAPGGGAVLEIGDDGVGLPEGFEESRDSGAGLKLMRLLVENIGGGLNIKSHALGLTVIIRLPPMLGLVESN
jgi:two-component sensor histidine kinase